MSQVDSYDSMKLENDEKVSKVTLCYSTET